MMSAFKDIKIKNTKGKPEYALSALWCNFQRQYEFNPPHDHDGKLSFVIYLSIPDELKKENEEYKGKIVDLEVYSLCMVKVKIL